MQNNQKKSSKLAIRLEPKEKEMLFYFSNKLGISPSALVRNKVKQLINELEEKLSDQYLTQLTDINGFNGPVFSQEEIEELFEINK